MNKQAKKRKLTRITAMHYFKLVFRSVLLLAVIAAYAVSRVRGIDLFAGLGQFSSPLTVLVWLVWLLFVAEMILRFFPSKFESMGCQKQFARNYIPCENAGKPQLQSGWVTFWVAAAWLALNGGIGALYFFKVIDAPILLIISLVFAVCDMICILFFCPFQTWFMKNKCCTTCRIYNWDSAMMFTPLVFIPHVYTWSLVFFALLLLLRWEVTRRVHPERFAENTNHCLTCGRCQEKLCHHKRQLRHFLKANRSRLQLKGNAVIAEARARLEKK